MSNLWRHERAGSAAPVGSFAVSRVDKTFRPWASGSPDEEFDLSHPEPTMEQSVAQAQANSFAEGFDAGRRTVELEVAGEREALARLAESLDALRPEPNDALAMLLAETVDRLVRGIVGQANVDPKLIVERARAAAALLGEELAPSKMRVNPGDAAAFEGARIPVQIVSDPAVAPGAILLETASGWIEDGPAVRLDRLRVELDRLGAV